MANRPLCLLTYTYHGCPFIFPAWDYAWSSAAAHCGEGGDPARLLDLGAWFEEVPASEWKATLAAISDSGPEVDLLRLHTRTGRPHGSKDSVRRKRR